MSPGGGKVIWLSTDITHDKIQTNIQVSSFITTPHYQIQLHTT